LLRPPPPPPSTLFPYTTLFRSYSVSYLPSSGDQFSSLTTITQQVKPEKFNNYELGIKWDIHRDLSVTTAVYRLDRTNTRSTDPKDRKSTRLNSSHVSISYAVFC